MISTNVDTFETAEKTVLETYILESWSLVHIWIADRKTSVTPNHPYWTSGKGWVNASELTVLDLLRKPDSNLIPIQKIELEELDTLVTVYNFEVEDFHTYYISNVCVLVHNANYPETRNSSIPVQQKTIASNGLDYQSNSKHTPGQLGHRPNAGIEPQNSLGLFGESVISTSKPNVRFTFDTATNTLHRFFSHGNGAWHWSGSTNQGSNSLIRS